MEELADAPGWCTFASVVSLLKDQLYKEALVAAGSVAFAAPGPVSACLLLSPLPIIYSLSVEAVNLDILFTMMLKSVLSALVHLGLAAAASSSSAPASTTQSGSPSPTISIFFPNTGRPTDGPIVTPLADASVVSVVIFPS